MRALTAGQSMAGGRVTGVMHVGSLPPRKFTGHDVELLQLAADRAAAAVQSRAAKADRVTVEALQRSLVPPALPAAAGAEMAARYIPWQRGGNISHARFPSRAGP